MLSTYSWPRYAARPAPELGAPAVRRVPLVVVGAGPVGLALAIDLAQRGQPVLLLDDDNTVSIGSRGVCHARRTLEIFDRLGLGSAVVQRGVTWNIGRTFHRRDEVFRFDLATAAAQRRPGMVNLQQYHLEQLLVERAGELPGIDLRWQHRLVGVAAMDGPVRITIDSAEGRYSLDADWLVACDGARSATREGLGLDMPGRVFNDRFLIADVLLSRELFAAERSERWFWFDPPFHPGQSVLLHRQADGVWRIDFQLGPDADPELEKQPQRVAPRIRALLDGQGHADIRFELEWVSVYTFRCRRMARFRHGRVLFAGDSAHQVSPFGARGANSGVQDADNLGWKLDLVLRGLAPPALLDSYDAERGAAADENIRASTRSTDFMTPRTPAAAVLRDAVLSLAPQHAFARSLVNSGRLSVPTVLDNSPLNTPDSDNFNGGPPPGAPIDDLPLDPGAWLLERLSPGFTLLLFFDRQAAGADLAAWQPMVQALAAAEPSVATLCLPSDAEAAQHCDARPGTCYLLRPDQHVAARWRQADLPRLRAALQRATARATT